MGSERKGRSQQVSCCKAGDSGGGLGSQEQSERCESVFSLLVALGGAALGLAGVAYWSWGLGQSNEWGQGGYEGMVCGIHRRRGQG